MSTSVSLSTSLPLISPLATSASTSLRLDHSGRADDKYVHVLSDVLVPRFGLVGNFSLRTVVALRNLAVPLARSVFVLDSPVLLGYLLLGSSDFRGSKRIGMGRKRLPNRYRRAYRPSPPSCSTIS